MSTFKSILRKRILFVSIIYILMSSLLVGQTHRHTDLQALQDSIELLYHKNESIKQSNIELNSSKEQLILQSKEIENNISELSKLNYYPGRSILSYYIGGGLSPFQYKPTVGSKKNGFGFTTGMSYTYFLNSNWGIKLGVSLDQFSSHLNIDDLETSTPSIDNDTDNDGIPDSFNLLTSYSGLKELQKALLIGTALELSYRTKLSEKWDFIGNIGPKISFTAKSESSVTNGSYTTRGHYPQYGSETILPIGPGFGTYTPRTKEKNDLGVGLSIVSEMDFAYKIDQTFGIYVGPYFEYQLNRKTTNANQSLVSYEVTSPITSESVYNSVFNSSTTSKYNRYAIGLRVGINFDFGGNRQQRKEKLIKQHQQKMDELNPQKHLYNNQLNKNKTDSLYNAQRIENLHRLYNQQREKEIADSISNALRLAELARLAEEQRIRDSIDNADKVGVIMDVRTNQLTDEDMEVLKLPIVFEFGTAILTEKSNENVKKMADMLAKYPSLKFQVTGHTCDIGTDRANYIVGINRASVIKDAFTQGGTEPSQIEIFSKGKSEPLVPNINEENRRKNRRVVVVIED